MEKFTKGPWFAKDGDRFSREVIITTSDREDCFIIPVCEMDMHFDGDIGAQQAANASLIASAPEMYDELVDAKAAFEFIVESSLVNALYLPALHEQIESITAILAKARGKKCQQQ